MVGSRSMAVGRGEGSELGSGEDLEQAAYEGRLWGQALLSASPFGSLLGGERGFRRRPAASSSARRRSCSRLPLSALFLVGGEQLRGRLDTVEQWEVAHGAGLSAHPVFRELLLELVEGVGVDVARAGREAAQAAEDFYFEPRFVSRSYVAVLAIFGGRRACVLG